MKKCKVIAMILILLLLIASTSAFAAQKEGYVYTALGDSIAAGIGGAEEVEGIGFIGYTDLFNEHLTRIYGEGIFNDHAISGLTTFLLTDVIEGYSDDIVYSDKITISIGGNDILGPVITFVNTNLGELSPDEVISNLLSDVGLYGQLAVASNGFDALWKTRIARIIELNKNKAQIFVNTLYNPFKDNPYLYAYADQFITVINDSIIDNAGTYGYEVVDVYTKVNKYNNPKKLLIHNSLDPLLRAVYLHPTEYGYKMIYNMHKKLLMPSTLN